MRRFNAAILRGSAIAVLLFLALQIGLWSWPASAQDAASRIEVIHSFDATAGGSRPHTDLVQGDDGAIYGVADGGALNYGIVFRVTSDGAFSLLHTFDFYSTGADPWSGLIVGPDRNLYGTTAAGGVNGGGTVFRITPSGALSILYSFPIGPGEVGSRPRGRLSVGSDGNFYGATESGGMNGNGTIFRVSPGGNLTTLHTFPPHSGVGVANDGPPANGMLLASDGNFYGATDASIFKMQPDGNFTVLHTFSPADGLGFNSGLTEGPDGLLYGTTAHGGDHSQGTIFRVTKSGDFSTAHSFNRLDGASPAATLVVRSDGLMYGTTVYGGGSGTVFSFSTAGIVNLLHTFTAGSERYPEARLLKATDGKFYGSTTSGGGFSSGSIFRMTVTPPPPSNVRAIAGNRQVTLDWNPSVGASRYNVYLTTTADGPMTSPISSVVGTTATVSGLTNGNEVFFRLAAVNEVGVGPASSTLAATPTSGQGAGGGAFAWLTLAMVFLLAVLRQSRPSLRCQ